jgi:hypothetical protein
MTAPATNSFFFMVGLLVEGTAYGNVVKILLPKISVKQGRQEPCGNTLQLEGGFVVSHR